MAKVSTRVLARSARAVMEENVNKVVEPSLFVHLLAIKFFLLLLLPCKHISLVFDILPEVAVEDHEIKVLFLDCA